MRALQGVRVLDLSSVLAGPLCTQYLASFGAEVVKVESPRGDESRAWPPHRAPQASTAFLAVNRGKRSVVADLKTDAGREVVRRLAARSDVVVESASTGVSRRLGVDDATLREINPRLVYCSISGFGRTGPMASDRGYDMVLQAFSGFMAMTGEPGGAPVRNACSPLDQATGLNAVIGIQAALLQRARTGVGAYLEVSLFETAVALLGYELQKYWETGVLPRKAGSRHESLCPYQVFDTADDPILLGVANDAAFVRFCTVAGLDHLAVDPRFATNPQRVAHFDETVRIVADAMALRSRREWLTLLLDRGVPCSPLNTLGDITEGAQTAARGMLVNYSHPELGALRGVALPILFDGEPRAAGDPPPLLGEHTTQVLAELGFSAEEIAGMAADRAH